TDHDDPSASLQARDLAARRGYRFSVVPGMEVTTRRGHLLVYGIEERLPRLRTPEETAYAVAERGGWCIAPHPMSALTLSLHGPGLLAVANAGVLTGLEMSTPAPGRLGVVKAAACAEHLMVAETGGSDAHKRELIGSAYMSSMGGPSRRYAPGPPSAAPVGRY
ncbi:MAG: PHP-associated domain-containing protein, partial [Chloroflexia bacterium]